MELGLSGLAKSTLIRTQPSPTWRYFSGTWGRDGCGAGMPLSLYLCDRHEDRDCKISLGYTVILGHGGAGRSVSLRPAWLTASSRTARAA